jgi:hypothetical protein
MFAVGVDSLPVKTDTSAVLIGFQLNFNTLAKAAIMGSTSDDRSEVSPPPTTPSLLTPDAL